MRHLTRRGIVAGGTLLAAGLARPALAQPAFPDRPVTLVASTCSPMLRCWSERPVSRAVRAAWMSTGPMGSPRCHSGASSWISACSRSTWALRPLI